MLLHFNEQEASNYLKVNFGILRAPTTLRKMRTVGGGPKFRKAGRAVTYGQTSLDEYAVELLGPEVETTAELGEAS